MIVEYIRYQIPAEQAAAFVQAYQQAESSLKASRHCLAYELTRCQEDGTQFILRITWDSAQGHLEGFRKSPEFGPFLQAVRPYVPAVQEMRHYQRTEVVWQRTAVEAG